MLCVCPLCEINFTSKIVMQNSEYYSTSDAIFSSLRWGRKANEGCFKNRMAFPATFAFWQKLSDLPFRSYKALNIPQNGLHTYTHIRLHPGFQNTGLAIARPVLKINISLENTGCFKSKKKGKKLKNKKEKNLGTHSKESFEFFATSFLSPKIR